jgi:hypothetical protein
MNGKPSIVFRTHRFLSIALTLVAAAAASAPPATAFAVEEASSQQATTSKTRYVLGVTPADVDTVLEDYLEGTGGIVEQVAELNRLMESVCCAQHEMGCAAEYVYEALDVERSDLMSGISEHYRWLHGVPSYPLNQGSVQFGVLDFLRRLKLYGMAEGMLPVAYTRLQIRTDDESTFDPRKKVDPSDPSFRLLGQIVPGVSAKGGTEIILDYYSTALGLLMSARPINPSALALAVAEHRANHYTFMEKRFTGSGGRVLFEIQEDGSAVPNLSGCLALAVRQSPFFERAD